MCVPVTIILYALLISFVVIGCFQVLGKVVILVKTCGDEEEDAAGDAVKAGLKQKLKMYVSNSLFAKG